MGVGEGRRGKRPARYTEKPICPKGLSAGSAERAVSRSLHNKRRCAYRCVRGTRTTSRPLRSACVVVPTWPPRQTRHTPFRHPTVPRGPGRVGFPAARAPSSPEPFVRGATASFSVHSSGPTGRPESPHRRSASREKRLKQWRGRRSAGNDCLSIARQSRIRVTGVRQVNSTGGSRLNSAFVSFTFRRTAAENRVPETRTN